MTKNFIFVIMSARFDHAINKHGITTKAFVQKKKFKSVK